MESALSIGFAFNFLCALSSWVFIFWDRDRRVVAPFIAFGRRILQPLPCHLPGLWPCIFNVIKFLSMLRLPFLAVVKNEERMVNIQIDHQIVFP